MRISDWSSDVCSSDLAVAGVGDGCGGTAWLARLASEWRRAAWFRADCIVAVAGGVFRPRFFRRSTAGKFSLATAGVPAAAGLVAGSAGRLARALAARGMGKIGRAHV